MEGECFHRSGSCSPPGSRCTDEELNQYPKYKACAECDEHTSEAMTEGYWSDCGSEEKGGGDSPAGGLGPCSRLCRVAQRSVRRDDFGLPVSFSLIFNLLVGSVCCGAAAVMAPVWLLPRIALACVALAGFTRLYWQFRNSSLQLRCPPIRLLLATAAASAATIASSVVVAAVAMVATAAHVCWRAAITYGVGEEPRRWYSTLVGLTLDGLELGALLLQMMYMTQWVFGEFSVMPVMTTMGMMFTLFHNFSLFVATEDPLFWREDLL